MRIQKRMFAYLSAQCLAYVQFISQNVTTRCPNLSRLVGFLISVRGLGITRNGRQDGKKANSRSEWQAASRQTEDPDHIWLWDGKTQCIHIRDRRRLDAMQLSRRIEKQFVLADSIFHVVYSYLLLHLSGPSASAASRRRRRNIINKH